MIHRYQCGAYAYDDSGWAEGDFATWDDYRAAIVERQEQADAEHRDCPVCFPASARTTIDCPDCGGEGGFDDPRMAAVTPCQACNGTGIIEAHVGYTDAF